MRKQTPEDKIQKIGEAASELNGTTRRRKKPKRRKKRRARETAQIELITRTLAEIEQEDISWLWQQRIARRKITILAGDPSVSKSILTMDIASRVSRGESWPDGTPGNGLPANVLILAGEDDPADTIKPRGAYAGSDQERVTLIEGIKSDDEEYEFDLQAGLPALRSKIQEINTKDKEAPVALLIIDPLNGYLGENRRGSWGDPEVRRVLMPVAKLAREFNLAVLSVMHLNKTIEMQTLYRVSGSIAYAGLARIVLGVAFNPIEEEFMDRGNRSFVLATIKINIGPPQANALSYGIEKRENGHDQEIRIDWRGEIDIGPETLFGTVPTKPRPGRDAAAEFLRKFLANGPRPRAEILAAAGRIGISEQTSRRALAELGGISGREDPKSKKSPYIWELPESVRTTATGAKVSKFARPSSRANGALGVSGDKKE